jgi:hypothetical protein
MESPIGAVTSCFEPSGLIKVTLILPLFAFFAGLVAVVVDVCVETKRNG